MIPNKILPLIGMMAYVIILSSCGGNPLLVARSNAPARQLTVMAASSLTEAFTELGQTFETKYPDIKIVFNFAGSQQLAQQLANGAQADVFASANQKQMDIAVQNGRVNSEDEVVFASNQLVVVYPIDNPGKVTNLADLAKPGGKILIAAPEVPVGGYTLEFLDKATQAGLFGADYKAQVLANVVSYETTVKAVVVKVGLGEADAGIVYGSDITPTSKANLGQIEIPASLNVIAAYPIAPILDGQHDLAKLWINYILSDAGTQILSKYSFKPVH